MNSSSLKFGTSGLRGLVVDLIGAPAYAYARAFSEMVAEDQDPAAKGEILVARDLRGSSQEIAERCTAAVGDSGQTPVDCGAAPTPALALAAMTLRCPAIMVTGSHIPEDRNGLKFYTALGEIDKNDEARILKRLKSLSIDATPASRSIALSRDIVTSYSQRYREFFGERALADLTVGVYQHSSVARDLICEILEELGATPAPLGRAERFIPVDTEALRPEDESAARAWAKERRFDAIVSTDGDADRPLVADASGEFLRGDLVGAMTSAFLGADAIVTPVTANSALEMCGRFKTVLRTRVGSPYVIAGMKRAAAAGAKVIVGFEANGGVLLGSDVIKGGRTLAALPTRDALLPILSVLRVIAQARRPLAALAAEFGFAHAFSGRLQNVSNDKSAAIIDCFETHADSQSLAFAPLGGIAGIDRTDGLRLTTRLGETVHFRASGNAPELRVYVEASTVARAGNLLAFGLDLVKRQVAACQ